MELQAYAAIEMAGDKGQESSHQRSQLPTTLNRQFSKTVQKVIANVKKCHQEATTKGFSGSGDRQDPGKADENLMQLLPNLPIFPPGDNGFS